MKKWILVAASLAVTPAHADILDGITPTPEVDGSNYDREHHFGDWTDDDGDKESTRQEVLAAESLVPVTWKIVRGERRVATGLWYDPFTGQTFTRPNRPSGYAEVQIDHIVPLKEAWESGAQDWSPADRVKYANDMTNPGHLLAIRGGTNGSKAAQDPAEWMPPNEKFHCAYVTMWVAIKKEWNLTIDQAEFDKIKSVMSGCE